MKQAKMNIERTPLGAALRAARMHRDALGTLKEQLEASFRPGVSTAQRTELRSRIAKLETEVAYRDAEVRSFMTDDPAARARGTKLIEARKKQSNVERASRGLPELKYETRDIV